VSDLTAPVQILNGNLGNILNFLGAAVGLGTAAMGFVDSTKTFWGGPSNFGFGYIRKALDPFLIQAHTGAAVYGKVEVLQTLRANWLNGVTKAEQKAKAKSLIHLGLTQGNAGRLAVAAGVDALKLTAVAQKTANGVAPTQEEINVLGQFDAILSAVLDTAYERGDQKYRNASKFLAMLAATAFAIIGGWIVYGIPERDSIWSYFSTREFVLSFLVGASATPLAPVAKDLASSLHHNPDVIWRACERLCRQGRAIFDVESRDFRHRELFEQPVDEARMFPPDERVERARVLLATNAVPFARCEPQETRKTKKLKTPDGPVTREVVYRDWRVTGNVAAEKTEIVVGDSGRIIFGTCSCAFFQENLLGKGPCEHMLALFKASADGRKDLPTSVPIPTVPARPPKPTPDEETETEAGEEDFDENEEKENNEGR